jgi:hypothetical protein
MYLEYNVTRSVLMYKTEVATTLQQMHWVALCISCKYELRSYVSQ